MDMPEDQGPPERIPFRERRAVVEEIARDLDDPVTRTTPIWWHYLCVVNELGAESARALARDALLVEAEGGMMTKDNSRRRTPGGVFFALLRQRLGGKKASNLRAKADGQYQREMLGRFLKLLELVLPASISADTSATDPQPPHLASPGASIEAASAELAPDRPAGSSAPTPSMGGARRPAPTEIEVVIVRRRKA